MPEQKLHHVRVIVQRGTHQRGHSELIGRVHIRADSELLVKQMRGEYKVKNAGLQPLYVRARLLAAQLDDVKFEHVRREFNKEADRLSNAGMDEAEEGLRLKAQGLPGVQPPEP